MAQHSHSVLACLDVETVPERDLLPPDTDPAAFPKLPYHRVVAVSFVEAEIVREDAEHEWYRVTGVRSGGREDYTEAQILKEFWRWFADWRPRVVTYNGRGFDLPLLKLRALFHGVAADTWYKAGDRWSTHGQRYSADWHCDLYDVLSDYGATRNLGGLDDVCRSMGLPSKINGHGSEVADMVAQCRIADVRAYCEGDVLNTFALYVEVSGTVNGGSAEALNRPHDQPIALPTQTAHQPRPENIEWHRRNVFRG
ncbi:ribonuclease H-like domain-containing protein [Azospirillum ramasamyi]|uniref:3'-5' exonuclease n=1 Tax=Azospirillum ramasamyi TaxID=682998 RepID=A0A2U9SEQ2_9PROT|nr:ribonuclease H-like domain-containing protein [Azospirillum ramasamyi]AWU98100.1 3'-5' exonuclease [Azospirillum ramasamyi]